MNNETISLSSQDANYNGVTGAIYSTQNQKHLEEHKEAFNLTSSVWAGYKQWQDKGRQVKKGAKACKIYMVVEKKITDAKGNTFKNASGDDSKHTVVKGRAVFNYEHTEAIAG